ncbi:MAG TPA: hypothetical protein VK737_02655 [Opitutales bacterium]|nr:hypothetical protein [Opitutales bacterium]
MLNPIHSHLFSKKFTRCVLAGLGLAGALTNTAHAWVTLDLPDLTAPEGGSGVVAYSNLPDGRLVYGNNQALYVQNNFGSAALTSFSTPPDMDPSFVTVLNSTTAVFGVGEFTNSAVYQFNPSTPATPGYSSNSTLQNYAAAPAGASGVYVAGQNDINGDNSISYVTLSGTQQMVVDPAGEFSAGLAVDGGGNVYVGDNDNNSVYEFTAAQIQNAIRTSIALTLSNALLIHTFSDDVVGSLAVDAEGRIWAAGFGAPGLFYYNPGSGIGGVLDPEDNADDLGGAYTVGAFSANGSDYVSYLWQSDFSSGSSLVYGFDTVQNVPEPAQAAWLAAAAALGVAYWRKRRRNESLA